MEVLRDKPWDKAFRQRECHPLDQAVSLEYLSFSFSVLSLNPLFILHEIPLLKYFNFVISRMCCCKVITWQGYHLSILQWDCGPFALHCGVLGRCLDICPPRAQRGQLWRSALHKGLSWHSNGSSLLLVHQSKAVCHCPRLTASPSIPRPTACRHHSCSFAEPRELTTLDLSSRLFPHYIWGSKEQQLADQHLNAVSGRDGSPLQTLVTSVGIAACIHLFAISSHAC